MSTDTSISLDDHFADFLAREVATGRYRSASEVVRAGLRLLEDQETRMAALRAALIEGEQSGEPESLDLTSEALENQIDIRGVIRARQETKSRVSHEELKSELGL